MNILLTGGNGLVGKNILEHPSCLKHTFHSPSSKSLDLLDKKAVKNFCSQNNFDLVIHAAGIVGGINANITNPVTFLRDNTEMGINIISASKASGIKNFINLASSCMYPRNAKNPLSEDLILSGELEPTNEGYALANIVCMKLCEYISKEDPDYKYKTIIPCNLYGKHDNFNKETSHMIPGVIQRIHEAKDKKYEFVEIWGDGKARREFMNASSFADFLFFAVSNFKKMPSVMNVGLGEDYSIKEYYEIVASVIGYEGSFVFDTTKPTGMKQKLVDSKKMNNFGWRHSMSLEDGIKEAYKFYKDIL